ncbi:MAG: hypothetical protein AAFM91_15890 [Pseudomonadota bacterium]
MMNPKAGTICTAVALFGLTIPTLSHGAALRHSYQACEQAISAELGDGRLRSDLTKAHVWDGRGRHWINVRYRDANDAQTQRLRVYCRTGADGDVARLDVEAGRWKDWRVNRAPKPID